MQSVKVKQHQRQLCASDSVTCSWSPVWTILRTALKHSQQHREKQRNCEDTLVTQLLTSSLLALAYSTRLKSLSVRDKDTASVPQSRQHAIAAVNIVHCKRPSYKYSIISKMGKTPSLQGSARFEAILSSNEQTTIYEIKNPQKNSQRMRPVSSTNTTRL